FHYIIFSMSNCNYFFNATLEGYCAHFSCDTVRVFSRIGVFLFAGLWDKPLRNFGPTWPEVRPMSAEPRELTRRERTAIRRLVTGMCANYDPEYGCLPLDYGGCYMLDKYWTGAYCKYFKKACLRLTQCWKLI
ncbi:cysteine-rich VLP protein, partial [Anaeromonas gelatinilytica]|uniref:cysteine-rich VLP protein n=1 Tax=Anaeromonas gelatinilytica TaxID=2683194 RepID=UPI003CCC67F8